MCPRPAALATFETERRTFEGSSGVPTSVVKTRPRSLAHWSPATARSERWILLGPECPHCRVRKRQVRRLVAGSSGGPSTIPVAVRRSDAWTFRVGGSPSRSTDAHVSPAASPGAKPQKQRDRDQPADSVVLGGGEQCSGLFGVSPCRSATGPRGTHACGDVSDNRSATLAKTKDPARQPQCVADRRARIAGLVEVIQDHLDVLRSQRHNPPGTQGGQDVLIQQLGVVVAGVVT